MTYRWSSPTSLCLAWTANSLICRIRAAENTHLRDIPIIVITGAADEETRERAFACGANDFITKPIDGAQLLACARVQAKLDEGGRKLALASEQLAEQESVDPLTQLNSRRLFVQRCKQDLETAKGRGAELSLIRLDVDDLKAIYGEHGDDVGDRVLMWLAKIIAAQTRGGDTLARIAGGAFAISTPTAGRLDAAILCERLRSAVNAEPFRHADINLPITASIGLVTFGRDPGDNVEDLMALAEQRVAAAAAAGGDRLSVDDVSATEEGDSVIVEQPDINTALEMIQRGDGGPLEPYLVELARTVLPVVELCNSKLDLQLDFELDSIKDKLSEMK